MRQKVKKKALQKEKEDQEARLIEQAERARKERAGIRLPQDVDSSEASGVLGVGLDVALAGPSLPLSVYPFFCLLLNFFLCRPRSESERRSEWRDTANVRDSDVLPWRHPISEPSSW